MCEKVWRSDASASALAKSSFVATVRHVDHKLVYLLFLVKT